MSARARIGFTLNGKRVRVQAPPMKRLLDVLRIECGLTGTKEGCGEGECGACTVLIDGATVNSCLVPVAQAEGTRILTVEGLSRGPRLNALQEAFVRMGGAQCGICTPGMLISAHALLAARRGQVPSDAEIREALAGNLCRCTGYQKIVDAVKDAAKSARARSSARAPARPARATRRKPAARAKAQAPRSRTTSAPRSRTTSARRSRSTSARRSAR